MAEVIEAEATVEETGTPVQLGTAFKWLVTAEAKVSEALEDGLYTKPEIKSAEDYKLAKSHRTQIRALIKDIDDKKKSYTSEIKLIVRDFEMRTNSITSPLTSLDKEYKESLDEWDAHILAQKMERLEAYFFDLVPALQGVVSFGVAQARFDQKGDWAKKSYSEVKAQEDLDKAAKAIEAEYQAIDAMGLSDEERQELQSDYIEHLDLNQALTKHHERQERKKRLAAIEAERQAAERAREEAAKRAEAETPIAPVESAAPAAPVEPVQPAEPAAYAPEPEQSEQPQQEAVPYQLYIASGSLNDWMLAIGQLMAMDAPISIDTQLTPESRDLLIKTLKANNLNGKLRRY